MGSSSSATPVIVFGAGGFIGGALMRALSCHEQWAVQGFTSHDADLADAAQVTELQTRLPRCTAWIVAAARNPDHPGPAIGNMLVNIAVARNLAGLIPHLRPPHILYLSSIDVYGRSNLVLPLNESSPLQPESPYAASKVASEKIFAEVCERFQVPLAVVRLPGVYGPGDPHHGPVRSFIDAARNGAPIAVHGDGEQVRDLLYVEDVPRIAAALIAARAAGVFNAVSGRSVSLNALRDLISAMSGRPLQTEYREAPQFDLRFEISNLKSRLPGFQFTPIEEGLRATYTSGNPS